MKLVRRRVIKEMRDKDFPESDNIEDRQREPNPLHQTVIRANRQDAIDQQVAGIDTPSPPVIKPPNSSKSLGVPRDRPPPPLPPPVESDSPKPEGQGGVGSDGVASKREADYTARRERNAQGLEEKIIAKIGGIIKEMNDKDFPESDNIEDRRRDRGPNPLHQTAIRDNRRDALDQQISNMEPPPKYIARAKVPFEPPDRTTTTDKVNKEVERLDKNRRDRKSSEPDRTTIDKDLENSARDNPATIDRKTIDKEINETISSLIKQYITEARIKIIKARIRNGKIQRRKKVSNVAGYTMRNNKLTRMSPAERRKRKLGAKRGKIKRKAKLSRSLRKRKLSLQKRKRLNIR